MVNIFPQKITTNTTTHPPSNQKTSVAWQLKLLYYQDGFENVTGGWWGSFTSFSVFTQLRMSGSECIKKNSYFIW